MERLRAALRGDPVMTSPEDAFAYGEGIPPDATWRNLLPAVELGLGLAPGSGEAMSLQDAWNASGRAGNALLSGDYGQAASDYLNMGTGLLGAIPGAGIIARGTKRGAAWMDRNLPEGFNRLLDSVYPDDPRSTTNIFAGPTAKTADHQALAQAQDMAAQGVSRDDIWRDTGWMQGTDGKWKFEIDDSGARLSAEASSRFDRLKRNADTEGQTTDMFRHPELASAYGSEDFGKMRMYRTDEPSGEYLRPSSAAGLPETYTLRGPNQESVRSTGLHEFQHGVQEREGFANGGNEAIGRELSAEPIHGDIQALRDYIDSASRNLRSARGAYDGPFEQHLISSIAEAEAELSNLQSIARSRPKTAYDGYKQLAGEVEARNVQSRMNMTAAERRATPPWETQDVPDDQQIVRFGGGGPQNSIDMGEASRLTRSRQMGYADEPFYRGEATGNTPDQYDTAFFSRDPQYAQGFAEKGGQAAPREFRLNLTDTFSDGGALTASKYGSLVEAAAKNDPALARELAESIAPGKGVDWLIGFSKANPDFVVVEPGAAAFVRQAIETNSSDPVGLFRSAGFTAIDSGRDVRKLTGEGIRLKNARFDPSKASSRDIMAGIAGASLLPAYLLSTSQKD